jgi:hypothetical protein
MAFACLRSLGSQKSGQRSHWLSHPVSGGGLVGIASVAFPLAAVLASIALARHRNRTAGLMLLLSVGTPTYFAYVLNVPALLVGLALVLAPDLMVGAGAGRDRPSNGQLAPDAPISGAFLPMATIERGARGSKKAAQAVISIVSPAPPAAGARVRVGPQKIALPAAPAVLPCFGDDSHGSADSAPAGEPG